MPDTPSGGGAKNSFGFLGRKLGPAPVWLWAALAIGAYYLYTKYKSGSSSSSSSSQPAVDPATGVTYEQELSDAENTIQQLQAQVNQQSQGQTVPQAIDVDVTQSQTQTQETSPGSGTPKPGKPPAPGKKPEKKIPAVAGNPADRAVSTVEAAGFETHTDPYRNPALTYTATGTTPSGQAPEGSVVVIHVRESGKQTTKAKKTARPRTPYVPPGLPPGTNPGGPVRRLKPVPAKHPARRAA